MAKLIMRVEGMDGTVELMNDRVVVRRQGLWTMLKYGLNSTREIPLAAISEVVFRPAGGLIFGQIDFLRGGQTISGGMKKNTSDTAVKFKKKKQRQFEMLKEKIFEMVSQHTKNHG